MSSSLMLNLKKTQRFTKQVHSDEASSFISCPEYVAQHIAAQTARMGNFKRAVELCSCIGALCFQLAQYFDRVVGIELNPERVEMARKNAVIYGVEEKVEFIQEDVLDENLLSQLKADVVFLDPGWSTRIMDTSSHVSSIDETRPSLRKMFAVASKHLSKNIVARVPATFSVKELDQLGFSRIENIHIDGRLVFKVAYYLEKLDKSHQVEINFS